MEEIINYIYPKIDEETKIKIESIEKIISERNLILIDHYRLLKDGILAMKNDLFFASSWVFYVFIEKYLRDLLIKTELEEQKPNFNKDDLLSEIDKIERNIEDEKDWYRTKYSFNKICIELKNKEEILDNEYKNFIDLYKNFRNPIQHGIYQRLCRNSIWDNFIPTNKINIDNIKSKEDFENLLFWEPNYDLNKNWLVARWFILPQVMFIESEKMLDIILQLINKHPIY